MEILAYIENNYIEIILILSLGLIGLLVLSLINLGLNIAMRKKYNKFISDLDVDNLEDLLIGLQEKRQETEKELEDIKAALRIYNKRIEGSLTKLATVRYNAFEDLGNNMSFSLAVLDERGDGFILTSIYGRDYNSSYLKLIQNGKSDIELSKEEDKALKKALSI